MKNELTTTHVLPRTSNDDVCDGPGGGVEGGVGGGGEVREYRVDFPRSLRATHRGPRDEPMPPRLPRIARLMALAIHCDRLISEGVVRDYAHLARIGHVTRARVTQIMNLLFLAPDIQEQILQMPSISEGGDPITERHLRPIVAKPDWRAQRRIWKALTGGVERAGEQRT